jgi:hypothetical protein
VEEQTTFSFDDPHGSPRVGFSFMRVAAIPMKASPLA